MFFRLPDIALRSVGRSYGWHTQGQTLKSPEVTFYANCNILWQKKLELFYYAMSGFKKVINLKNAIITLETLRPHYLFHPYQII